MAARAACPSAVATCSALLTARSIALAGRIRRSLPQALAGPAVRVAGRVGCLVLRQRRRAAESNFRWLVGPGDRRAAARFSRSTFQNFARCQADVLSLAHLDRDSVFEMLECEGRHHLDAALSRGRGAIVVTAHVGNWDLCGAAVAAFGYPMCAVFEPIDPARDALFATFRTATGLRLISADRGAALQTLRALRSGAVVGFVGDRPLGSAALEVPFARGRRSIPIGPAWLALRARAPLLTGYAILTPGAARPYRLVVEPEVSTLDLGDDPVATLTMRIADRLSAAASLFPDQWFVFDPQWQPVRAVAEG